MATAQPGIFALGTRAHHHVELDLVDGASLDDVRARAGRLREKPVAAGGVNLVVGFGADLWRRLAPNDVPDGLAPFAAVDGIEGHGVPATQHDVWVWAHGTGPDICLDAARRAVIAFAGVGGSFALLQRWVHDLSGLDALDEAGQEAVFGRTKRDSIAIDRAERGVDSHIVRVEIHDAEGEEEELWRRSTPWGAVGHHGLTFLAFSADPMRYRRMFERIFGIEDGIRDRLTDYSTATNSAECFCPSLDALDGLVNR